MPHSVTCGACKASFSIPDEVWDKRVYGQVATLKCRHCKAPIEVDGRRRRGSATNIATSLAATAASTPKDAPTAQDNGTVASPKEPVAVVAPAVTAVKEPKTVEAKPQEKVAAQPSKLDPKPIEPKINNAAPATTKATPQATKGSALQSPRAELKQSEPGSTALKFGTEQPAKAAQPVGLPAASGSKPGALATAASAITRPGATSAQARKIGDRVAVKQATLPTGAFKSAQEPTPKPKNVAATQPQAKPSSSTSELDWDNDAGELWVVGFGVDDDREITTIQLEECISKGQVDGNTIVWKDGMSDWLPISKVPELAGILKPKHVALAPAPAGVTAVVAAKPTQAVGDDGDDETVIYRAGSNLAAAMVSAAATSASAAPQREVFRKSAVEPAAAKATPTGAKAGGGPPPLRRQPSRPDDTGVPNQPANTVQQSRGNEEVVTSVREYAPTRVAAAPPPLPPAEKRDTPAAKPAIFPPAVATAQAFSPVHAESAHTLRATPSFAPRPSDIAALTKIRPKFPKWLPFAVLAGLVLLVAVMAALSWVRGDNAEGADRKPAPDVSGPLEASPTRPTTSTGAGTAKTEKPSGGDLSSGFASKFAQAAAKQRPTARFDRDGAEKALAPAFAKAAGCHNKGEPTGTANVTVSIAPSGQVLSVTVAPPFATTFTADCIRSALREASVPPFQGSPGRLAHSITIH